MKKIAALVGFSLFFGASIAHANGEMVGMRTVVPEAAFVHVGNPNGVDGFLLHNYAFDDRCVVEEGHELVVVGEDDQWALLEYQAGFFPSMSVCPNGTLYLALKNEVKEYQTVFDAKKKALDERQAHIVKMLEPGS